MVFQITIVAPCASVEIGSAKISLKGKSAMCRFTSPLQAAAASPVAKDAAGAGGENDELSVRQDCVALIKIKRNRWLASPVCVQNCKRSPFSCDL